MSGKLPQSVEQAGARRSARARLLSAVVLVAIDIETNREAAPVDAQLDDRTLTPSELADRPERGPCRSQR